MQLLAEARKALVIIFAIFLGLFLYTKIAGPIPFSVNSVTTKQNLFMADGTGEATAVPDTVLISLGVTADGQTARAAQNKVNESAKKIIDGIKSLGIEEKNIKTTGYSVNPSYDFTGGQQISGYQAAQNIEVRVKPVDKAEQAVDVATKNGANLVGGTTFVLNDDVKDELLDKARKQAIEKAKKKAKSLAEAAGIRLGRIIDVQEFSDQPPYGYPVEKMVEGGRGGGANTTQLPPGENKVSVTVTLSYETY